MCLSFRLSLHVLAATYLIELYLKIPVTGNMHAVILSLWRFQDHVHLENPLLKSSGARPASCRALNGQRRQHAVASFKNTIIFYYTVAKSAVKLLSPQG